MKDKLYDTPDKIEVAISNFLTLQQHPGWLLVKEIVDANIEVLKETILAGGPNEVELNRLRDRLQAYTEVINTPQDQIRMLKETTSPAVSFDPYEKLVEKQVK